MDLSSEMAVLLAALYESVGTGDSSVWTDSLAADAVFIGTDRAEWWRGRDVILPVMAAQAQEMSSIGTRLTGGSAHFVAVGDVVWVSDRPTYQVGDGAPVELRLTALALWDGAHLVLHQAHLSAPADDQQIAGRQLTV